MLRVCVWSSFIDIVGLGFWNKRYSTLTYNYDTLRLTTLTSAALNLLPWAQIFTVSVWCFHVWTVYKLGHQLKPHHPDWFLAKFLNGENWAQSILYRDLIDVLKDDANCGKGLLRAPHGFNTSSGGLLILWRQLYNINPGSGRNIWVGSWEMLALGRTRLSLCLKLKRVKFWWVIFGLTSTQLSHTHRWYVKLQETSPQFVRVTPPFTLTGLKSKLERREMNFCSVIEREQRLVGWCGILERERTQMLWLSKMPL